MNRNSNQSNIVTVINLIKGSEADNHRKNLGAQTLSSRKMILAYMLTEYEDILREEINVRHQSIIVQENPCH